MTGAKEDLVGEEADGGGVVLPVEVDDGGCDVASENEDEEVDDLGDGGPAPSSIVVVVVTGVSGRDKAQGVFEWLSSVSILGASILSALFSLSKAL